MRLHFTYKHVKINKVSGKILCFLQFPSATVYIFAKSHFMKKKKYIFNEECRKESHFSLFLQKWAKH